MVKNARKPIADFAPNKLLMTGATPEAPLKTTEVTLTATGNIVAGSGSATANITSSGAYDLELNTNSGTNSGTITITDGANGNITIDPDGTGKIVVGSGAATANITSQGTYDLRLDTNSGTNSSAIIITDAANGDISLTPDGTGSTVVGSGAATAKVTSKGAYDLTLNTNSGSNSSAITITDAANGNISLVLDGTGKVVTGSGAANAYITSSGAYDLLLETNSGTNSGTIGIVDGANGNITFAPNGTGKIVVGSGGAAGVITSSGAYDLTLNTNSGTNSSSINIVDAANGNITNTLDGTGKQVITTADAGAVGAVVKLYHNSATPAAADVMARFEFDGMDSGGNQTTYGKQEAVVRDTTNGSEDGDIEWSVIRAGTLTKSLAIDSDVNGIVIGDGAGNATINSSGNYDMIIATGNATTGNITLEDGANGNITVEPNGTGTMVLKNTSAGALGSVLDLYQLSASPANSDVVGRILFDGNNNAAAKKAFGRIDSVITDVTGSSEDGDLEFYVSRAGTVTKSLAIDSDVNGIVVGDGVADGIVQSSGSLDLILKTGNATTGTITIADGANGNITVAANGTGKLVVPPIVGGVQSLSGAGAVNLTTLITNVTSTGANALTLADGVAGQIKIITMIVDAGDATLTPTNFWNGSTLTFNDVGDSAILGFMGTKWALLSNVGCALA